MKLHFPTIRSKRFPAALFGIVLVGLLLASGFHMGFVVLITQLGLSNFLQVNIPILYWIIIASGVTALIVQLTKNVYERPLKKIAQAARQVAGGDFSVYVPPIHAADKQDYMDDLILDFNKMVEELGSIETLKTDFFSNVSHEIKTPLAVIQNSADMLKKSSLSEEERAEYVDTIARASRRLSGLITNILKLNKLEKQNIQPIPEPYNLCEQLAECALLFEDRWEKKGIEFEADIEDQATIEADASLLELVWNNLLSNAIKFTEPGGTVTLRQTSTADSVEISVSDTGCGMDAKTLEHIFDKFYQGDTSHSTEGNGLGLALVLRILRMVGGDISVTSSPGTGSTFTVKIPASKGGK
ncbi:MAG: HAMP domain-containing histidine kinase [Oscillospiraceae bacterium]|nr:HAMP domain-containing histidine kinase [Oscillospiraceae bacterium]